jgi:hypothetical protein
MAPHGEAPGPRSRTPLFHVLPHIPGDWDNMLILNREIPAADALYVPGVVSDVPRDLMSGYVLSLPPSGLLCPLLK